MVRECFEIDELFHCSLMEDCRSVDLIFQVRKVFFERIVELFILVDDGQRLLKIQIDFVKLCEEFEKFFFVLTMIGCLSETFFFSLRTLAKLMIFCIR